MVVVDVAVTAEERRPDHCQFCQKSPPPTQPLRRCGKCRAAWYCSVACQRHDWNNIGSSSSCSSNGGGHRRVCKNATATKTATANTAAAAAAAAASPKAAWKELSQILATASLDQVQHDYYLASDKVKSSMHGSSTSSPIKKKKNKNTTKDDYVETTTITGPVVVAGGNTGERNISAAIAPSRAKPAATAAAKMKSIISMQTTTQSSSAVFPILNSGGRNQTSTNTANVPPGTVLWNYCMEDMPQLQCFHILLRPATATSAATPPPLRLDDFTVSRAAPSGSKSPSRGQAKTIVSFAYGATQQKQDEALLRIELPQTMSSASSPPPRVYLVEDDRAISVRLSYACTTTSAASNDDDSLSEPDTLIANYHDHDWTAPAHTTALLLAPDQASKLACGYCLQRLLLPRHVRRKNDDENDGDGAAADDDAPIMNAKTTTTTTTTASSSSNSTIERVLPLPSGRWAEDEMQDYLVCYEGQATFDFSFTASTCGQKKTLLQDETVLVAHQHDVVAVSTPTTSTTFAASCVVLATTGFGEEDSNRDDDRINNTTNQLAGAGAGLALLLQQDKDPTALVRGSRPWREAVGGATLTCSLCASVLGFAPVEMPDTFRFLKHRLVLLDDSPPSPLSPTAAHIAVATTARQLQTVSSFVAHEMIRYAETKAIFTFVVSIRSDDAAATALPGTYRRNTSHQDRRRVLFLRLVSWDTTTATGVLADSNTTSSCDAIVPQWRRSSKILYCEETVDDAAKDDGSLLWMWTSTTQDWCCPTAATDTISIGINSSKEGKAEVPVANNDDQDDDSNDEKQSSAVGQSPSAPSLVRLCLSAREWEQLRAELQETSGFYAKDVVKATIAAKLGQRSTRTNSQRNEGKNIGLACVAL